MKLLLSLDKRFVNYTKIAISFLNGSNNDIDIELIVDEPIPELSDYKQHLLPRDRLKDLAIRPEDRVGLMTYARLFIPELVTDCDKCIYIDGDIACVTDLSELENYDIPFIGAVKEADDDWLTPGIGNRTYYNAGFLVLNLKALREEGFTDKCLDYIRSNRYLGTDNTFLHDQTVINDLYSERITPLPDKFNKQLKWKEPGQRYIRLDKSKDNLHFLTAFNKHHYINYAIDNNHLTDVVDIILLVCNNPTTAELQTTIDSIRQQSYKYWRLHIIYCSANKTLDRYFKNMPNYDNVSLINGTGLPNKHLIYTFLQKYYTNNLTGKYILFIDDAYNYRLLARDCLRNLLSITIEFSGNLTFSTAQVTADDDIWCHTLPNESIIEHLIAFTPLNCLRLFDRSNSLFDSMDFSKSCNYPLEDLTNCQIISNLLNESLQYPFIILGNSEEDISDYVIKGANNKEYAYSYFKNAADITFSIIRNFSLLGYSINYNQARFLNRAYTGETELNDRERLDLRQIRKQLETRFRRISPGSLRPIYSGINNKR